MDDDVKSSLDVIEYMQSGWSENYLEAKADLQFLYEDQWPQNVRSERLGRHCITNDRLLPFCNQVVNEVKQNTPTIKVLPADSEADVETAGVIQDYIRNIEYVSGADSIYDTAVDCSVQCGIGYILVDHDYVSPDTFEQHILLRRAPNPFGVLIDPNTVNSDGSDANCGAIVDTLTTKEFKKQYPGAVEQTFNSMWMQTNATCLSTASDELISIAQVFTADEEEREIVQLSNGLVVFADALDKLEMPYEVVNTRKIKRRTIKRKKISGAEVLESTMFPSSYIPIVPVYGKEMFVNGKRKTLSLIRNSKDAQMMYNLWSSTETELLQKSPKSPYMMAAGQDEGFEAEWQNPDLAMVLHYNQVDSMNNPAPMPGRIAPPQVPTGVVNARLSCVDDIKSTMGIYDASIGKEGNEKSGRAILARQQQGNNATYHFGDNLRKSIQHVGRIIIDMMPRVIDTARILRTIGEDGTTKPVMVNGPVPYKGKEKFDRIYDISVGKYDCIVTTGPSFVSKRAEAAETMTQLAQSMPIIGNVAPDILINSLDIPFADVLAKRLKKAVPPQFLDDEEGAEEDKQMQLMEAQQKLQQADMAIKELQAQMQQLEEADSQGQVKLAELQIKEKELLLKQQEAKFNFDKAAMEMDFRNRELALKEQENKISLMKVQADYDAKANDTQAKVNIAIIDGEKEIAVADINAAAAQSQSDAQIVTQLTQQTGEDNI